MNRGIWTAFSGLALAVVTACSQPSLEVTGKEGAPKIFLRDPPSNGGYVFPDALLIGELTIIDGCVMLIQNGNKNVAVIPSWPDYTKLMKSEDGYHITVRNKRLDFGKTYHFGGGSYDVRPNAPMHKMCAATSTWFVGEIN